MDHNPNKTEADFTYKRYTQTDMETEHLTDEGADPELVGDKYLAADIGLNTPEEPLGDDELVRSDAYLAADVAGLTANDANDEELLEMEEEDEPLEDVPDADEVYPGSIIDPVSPPIDAMPGTDLINGSKGE